MTVLSNALLDLRDEVRALFDKAEEDPYLYSRADEKCADLNEHIASLAQSIAETCGEALADKAASFTCDEANLIDELLVGFNSAFAQDFRRIHAEEDDEGDEHTETEGWNE